jgi:uncharacterized protein (TIGR02444 family)
MIGQASGILDVTLHTLPEHRFWKFSTQVYKDSSVEAAMLDLQNSHGLNVNLVLFLAWFGFNGQGRLNQGRVRYLQSVVGHWHERVVKPLRRLRKLAKSHSRELCDNLFEEELLAEQAEQLMLADALWHISYRIKSPSQKMADICRSLLAYCNVAGVKINSEVCNHLKVLLYVMFPMLDSAEISAVSEYQLLNKQRMVGSVGTQLSLDL